MVISHFLTSLFASSRFGGENNNDLLNKVFKCIQFYVQWLEFYKRFWSLVKKTPTKEYSSEFYISLRFKLPDQIRFQ